MYSIFEGIKANVVEIAECFTCTLTVRVYRDGLL